MRIQGCEWFVSSILTVAVKPTLRNGVISVRMSCGAQDVGDTTGCDAGVAFTFRHSGTKALHLGTARLVLATGRHGTARLRLNARQQRALRGISSPLLELHLIGQTIVAPVARSAGPEGFGGRWRVHL